MNPARRIIRLDNTGISVVREARFESEARLHEAIAAHPEVLPNEDFDLGPLVPLANELELGGGFLDLLATDALGKLVIVEFKRGTENPDVRQVVAQILEYGAALWRYEYDRLEAQCRRLAPGFADSLVDHVAMRLEHIGEPFDAQAFRSGIASSLDSGAFSFVYCGRDLDDRTRRIMTYLAEGPRMAFFAVEVDYFVAGPDEGAVMVPRTAFVPSWVTGPTPSSGVAGTRRTNLAEAPPEYHEMIDHMNVVAADLDLQISQRPSGFQYLPRVLEVGVQDATSGVGVFRTQAGVEFNFAVLRNTGRGQIADELLDRLEALTKISMRRARSWASMPCAVALRDWDAVRSEVVEPYFRAREESVQQPGRW